MDTNTWPALFEYGIFSPLLLVSTLLAAQLCHRVFAGNSLDLRLRPRGSSWQIATFPWVHRDWSHLVFNAIPILLLGGLISLQGQREFWFVTTLILLVSGWGTWLFSRATAVAGASGLVFGYWGFLLAAAALSRETQWLLAAAITLLFYAGLWTRLGDISQGVAWSAHFWGLAGGVLAAVLLFIA
jgi:membrane associated rhomboid family serine protease